MSSIHVKKMSTSIHSQPRSSCGQRHVPATLFSEKGANIHRTGGWVGPRAGVNGYEEKISYPYRHSNPRRCSPQRVAIQTALSQPHSVSESKAVLPKTEQRCIFVI
jgi:hypothetical protein